MTKEKGEELTVMVAMVTPNYQEQHNRPCTNKSEEKITFLTKQNEFKELIN